MPPLTLSALRRQIESADLGPLYVLVGDDEAEKSEVAGEIEAVVEEGLQAFNVERLYGVEVRIDDIIRTAATLPMLAPRRIVIVVDGEKVLTPKREGKAADEEQARLEAFIASPPSHATVVFVCGSLDLRRRATKLLVKQAHVVDCGTITDESDAERWATARAAKIKLPIDAAAVRVLVGRTGPDLTRLRSGLERLALYTMGQPKVSADDVRQAVPAAPGIQENFGIANAIQRNDAADALRQMDFALESGAPPVMVMGQLRVAAERLPAPRLRAAIDAVFRTDLALKSSGGEPRMLLERLVVELCEEKRRGVR